MVARVFTVDRLADLTNRELDEVCGTVTVARGLAYAKQGRVVELELSDDGTRRHRLGRRQQRPDLHHQRLAHPGRHPERRAARAAPLGQHLLLPGRRRLQARRRRGGRQPRATAGRRPARRPPERTAAPHLGARPRRPARRHRARARAHPGRHPHRAGHRAAARRSRPGPSCASGRSCRACAAAGSAPGCRGRPSPAATTASGGCRSPTSSATCSPPSPTPTGARCAPSATAGCLTPSCSTTSARRGWRCCERPTARACGCSPTSPRAARWPSHRSRPSWSSTSCAPTTAPSCTRASTCPRSAAGARPTLVGQPATGFFLRDGETLVLGALAEPLDGTRQRLLDLGVVEVPEADWARFIVTHLPGLRRKARVRAASGDLDLPDAVPPRLTLRATFEAGHRAHLEWGFRYGAAAGGVLVPMAAEEPDPMRDRAAERALVDELLEVDEVAGFDPLWQVVARMRRLVPETRLHGFTHRRVRRAAAGARRAAVGRADRGRRARHLQRGGRRPADPGVDVRPGRRRAHRLVRPRHLGHGGRRGRAAGAAHRGDRPRPRAPHPRQRHLVLARPARARDAAGAGRRGPLAAGQAHRPAAHLGGARRAVGGARRARRRRAAVRPVDPRRRGAARPRRRRAGRAARGARRHAAALPGRRLPLAVAAVGLRARRGARRRHGPGQDAADARDGAAGARARRARRPGARRGAHLGAVDLAERGGPVRSRRCAPWSSTAPATRPGAGSRRPSPARRSSSPRTPWRASTRWRSGRGRGARWCSTRRSS